GHALDILQAKYLLWPGGALPSNSSHHNIDVEHLRADEYDLFITDPTDFILRFLPRVFGGLEPLDLPTLGLNLLQSGFIDMPPLLTKPEFRKLGQTLLRAGKEEAKWRQVIDRLEEDMGQLGYPPQSYPGGTGAPPMDILSCRLRGMRGYFADVFNQPDKVLAACEAILKWQLARTKPADPKEEGYPKRVDNGCPHYGSDEFMNRKQFETFVWPTWKRALQGNIDKGYSPSPHIEGKCDERTDYFLELPKGKFSLGFREVDMERMKATLGGHCCLIGGIPAPLLAVGSVQEVDEYCEKLIKVLGKGGGYILSCNAGVEDAKPENLKAVIESAKKYGRY
ncbi:uroporphyrinogen decarboxylase family protein, partial [Chloroflexota bacterium]